MPSPERGDAHAECMLDGVAYTVYVVKHADGQTSITFGSSHPPAGQHHDLYQWHGRLGTP